jgi:hypothetical protein
LLQLASGPVNSTLTVSTGRPQAPINNLRASLSLGKNGRATAAATVSTASILVVPDRIRVSRRQSEPQPRCAKLALGNGAIQRPINGGATWEKCALWVEPNSTMYWFGTNPANSDIVVANSPIVQAAAFPKGGTSLGIRQFPAALNKFPDPIEKFPDTRFKIPCYCE